MKRFAIISDVHANMPALEAVLRELEGRGPFVKRYCLGDITGYGPFPNEAIQLVRDSGFDSILGNHDRAVRGGSYDGFNQMAGWAVRFNRCALTPENKKYLKGLKSNPVLDSVGGFALVHGSFAGDEDCTDGDYGFEDIYVHDNITAATAMTDMHTYFGVEYGIVGLGFVGHTHVPMHATCEVMDNGGVMLDYRDVSMVEYSGRDYSRDGLLRVYVGLRGNDGWVPKHIVNVGSVGQPRHGSRKACYGIVNVGDDGNVIVELRHIDYDVAAVQDRMKKEQFPEFLVSRLAKGA